MVATRRIDSLRVAQDPAYAAGLSHDDWYNLAQNPDWQQMLAEQPELVSGVLATHGHKLPGFRMAQLQPGLLPQPAPGGPFNVIGKPVPRVQGMGVVTGVGQYTEHLNMLGA